MMKFNTLSLEKNNFVGVLKFSRPQTLNALNKELITELNLSLDEIEKDKVIRVLVLSGAGDKAFIAGADIKEINGLSREEAKKFALNGQKTLSRLESLRVPTIAAVNGFALGGGLEMALACDMIWASEKAKLGLPEVSLGIIPGYGGTQRLKRWVGLGRAREITYSGQFYSAKEAYEFGLVQRVLSPDTLMSEVMKFAELIAARGPLAVTAAKRAINQTEHALEQGLLVEAGEFSSLFGTHDQKEGTAAFVEKRTPDFKGN
ncbi:MAG: hypothetical protein A4S09_09975 [Proteobacteria bacterium SG_bin7]|nr:MAG: hypothetical protein A4S09_09975 [Proteobacteria bacterium SG_bin7]